MGDARIRRQIALLAARLMYERQESEYFTAKRKAARQLGVEYKYHPGDLPSNAEIRDQIQGLACFYEGEKRNENLRAMRLEALRMMRLLSAFRPRLIGSVLTGHVRKGSDIDLHVFSNNQSAVTTVLDDQNLRYTVEHKRVIKHNEERVFTHVHVEDRYSFELTLYPRTRSTTPSRAPSPARRSSGPASPSWSNCCATRTRRWTWRRRSPAWRSTSTASSCTACCWSRWRR